MSKVKVGNIIKVTWIDSGCHYNRAGTDPANCRLSTCETFGRLVHENKERIVVAMDRDLTEGGPHNERYKVIWRPSIQKMRRLK